jgi:hypothetical protein
MNEIEVSVSSVVTLGRRRLPLIRVNRRFFICCALCAAMGLLLLIESRVSERSQAPASRPTLGANLVIEELPPLQMPPLMPPATPFVDTLTWRLAGQDYMTRRFTRWEKFETEYGMGEPEHSAVLRSMQSAKYNLDRVVFAANEFSRNLSSLTEYEFDHGRLTHVPAAAPQSGDELRPLMTVPRNVRLGLDVNVAEGRPYLGVKLIIPVGD